MNVFQKIQVKVPKKNKFDLSHEKKLSLKMGKLYPILVQDVLPNDSFKVSSEILLRMAPMIAPMMHRVNVYTHYFFVPNRLIWTDWEKFITGGETGNETPEPPYLRITNTLKSRFYTGTLSDYMGVPPPKSSETIPAQTNISSLPFRAYQTIWNEYYRDQNLQTERQFSLGGGQETDPDGNVICTLLDRSWEKDYFTSALPFPQRGQEAIIPIAGFTYKDTSEVVRSDTGGNPNAGDISMISDNPGVSNSYTKDVGNNKVRIENIDSIDPVSINDLRKANKVQEWLEVSARAGSRYIEQMLSFFGRKSSDARLQRPEYLGGGRSPIIISEVLQTTGEQTPSTYNPLGEMGGHGLSVGNQNGFTRTFEEHGYVIGIMSVIPKTAYSKGIPRHFTRLDKFEYYWPQFAHLGEQEILNKEVKVDYEDPADNDDTWGYQMRYAEYKYQPSTIAGDFRDTLEYWHMSRDLSKGWLLNEDFTTCFPTDRIYAVQDDTDKLYCQIYHKISALRPMPYHAIPSL